MMANFKTINSGNNMTRTGGIMSDYRSKQQLPDAKKHQMISFVKSGIRIIGYILIPFNLIAAAGILVISEVVGILEELV